MAAFIVAGFNLTSSILRKWHLPHCNQSSPDTVEPNLTGVRLICWHHWREVPASLIGNSVSGQRETVGVQYLIFTSAWCQVRKLLWLLNIPQRLTVLEASSSSRVKMNDSVGRDDSFTCLQPAAAAAGGVMFLYVFVRPSHSPWSAGTPWGNLFEIPLHVDSRMNWI